MTLTAVLACLGRTKTKRALIGVIPVALAASVLFASPARAHTIVVNTTDDQWFTGPAACSLREAIGAANFNTPVEGCEAGDTSAPDVIVLQSGGPYTLTLNNASGEDSSYGDLDIFSSMEIRGITGRSIIQAGTSEGAGIDRVFEVHDQADEVVLHSLEIRYGTTGNSGGGIRATGDTLTVSSSVIRDNLASTSSSDGGGLSTTALSTVLRNTSVLSNEAGGYGGGIEVDTLGNPDNLGSLTMRGGAIEENNATYGGGLYLSTGTASLLKTDLELNSADESGGGIYDCSGVGDNDGFSLRLTSVLAANNSAIGGNAVGGALAMCGGKPAKIASSTFFENFGGSGGAIYLASEVGAQSEITNSIFTANEATSGNGGGAIDGTSDLHISRSTFQANKASSGRGGAILQANGSLIVENSTFSANEAGHDGGAIYNQFRGIEISYSTFSNNTAATAPASDGEGGAIYNAPAAPGGTVTLGGTILANSNLGDDCEGEFVSEGYNLVEELATGCTLTAGPGDIRGVDPELRGLSNYGGRTQTHALKPISPALDAAGGDPGCPAIDQRGYDRPGDGPDEGGLPECDIGAFEDRPQHDRTLTLELKRHLNASGKLTATDGFRPCRKGIKVKIQRKTGGLWDTVGSDLTNRRGIYGEALPDKTGKYRALATEQLVTFKNASHFCHTALSTTENHDHPD